MSQILTATLVAVSTGHQGYPTEPPYSPDTAYAEYPLGPRTLSNNVNRAYAGVRETLRLLGLDAEHYGRESWNPLGEMVRPGNTVVLKPNFVRDFRETQAGHADCLITHGSIIRAALDYVYIALKGRGRIIIADAPQNDADFTAIRRIAGLNEIQEFYRRKVGFEIGILDLRPERARKIDGVIVGHERLPGDPRGYVTVDLGCHSMFAEVEHLCHLLYGSEYDTNEIRRHHTGGVHEYLLSKTVMDADCVINLPKLKTHKKTGITVCMKNLVGINGNKNWLPHHRLGTPAQGGDQFADDGLTHRIERGVMACFRRLFPLLGPVRGIIAKPLQALGTGIFGDTNTDTVRSGNWYGNDTTWRMVLDLNRILMYADSCGHLCDTPARRMFCIVDGVVGGEGNGPMDPTPKESGMVIAGRSPLAVDLTCARLVGFDYERLPLLREAMARHPLPIAPCEYNRVICRSDDRRFDRSLDAFDGRNLAFRPHFGWQGHIELNSPQASEKEAGSCPSREDLDGCSSEPSRMRRALSRKNLWENSPLWLKSTLGSGLGLLPPAWLLGRSFRKNCEFVREAQWWSTEQSEEYQANKLRAMLKLAYEKTGFYHRLFDSVGFHPEDLKTVDDMQRLPTCDKRTVVENLSDMCTTSLLDWHVDFVSTGGTSGTPLHFYINADRSSVEYAYLSTSWERAGYKLGMPLAVLRGHMVRPDGNGLRHEHAPILRSP